MLKKFLAFSLAMVLTAGCVPASFAAGEEAKVYDIYGSDMLFQQNEDAVISGTAPSGSKITAELFDKTNKLVASGECTASDGVFSVSFMSPSGGYDEYTIVLKCNGSEFTRLTNVVFGELWLASGQSNMMYPLAQEKDGKDMFTKNEILSKNIRVLLIPDYPEYKGTKELLPVDPQPNIPGSKWVSGENGAIYSMSAVAYYFADKMQKELDMPVGILNVALGGTTIASWLSRAGIDSCSEVKSYLQENGRYIEKADWKEDGQEVHHDMTTNFNQRIAPLKGFRPVGMIWYQGESDLMLNFSTEYYANSMELMQRSYAEYFNYNGDMLPAIYTQIASFPYLDNLAQPSLWNIGYSEMQANNSDSQAMITAYDVPTHYIPEAGVIHPETKQPIGERMAFAAMGLVHGERDTFTASTVENSKIENGAIYVTLQNIGSGLKKNGDKLLGFAICGDNGVYVQANAEIISSDTVKIWSEYVPEPKSASYACCLSNIRSNLYATENGELALPVSPFITDSAYNSHFWADKQWADCDSTLIWHNEYDPHANYYDSWSADGAALEFGEHMNISAEKKKFSVKPVLTYNNGSGNVTFTDCDGNYSDYGKMVFKVRNGGKSEVSLDCVRFYTDSIVWYAPAVEGTGEANTVIPADGEWHTVVLDLNSLYLFGNECGITFPCGKLGKVKSIELRFCGDDSEISLDEIRFAPAEESGGIRFIASIKNADNLGEFLSAIFVGFIGLFANLFN